MFLHTYRLFALGSAFLIGGSFASASQVSAQVKDLNPFPHVVLISAGIDLSSIRLQGVKMVEVPTRVRSTIDSGYCQSLGFRDPGGSMYCPQVHLEAFVPAYEVTYAYQGQPMSSDEYGSTYFTFSVYFRPEELSPQTRELLKRAKTARSDVAMAFKVITSRDPERRVAIDEAASTFCEGSYIDGAWRQANADCKDKITSKAVVVLPEYLTIRVEPVTARAAAPVGRSATSDLVVRPQ
jgi:hypothetical protein